MTSRMVPVWQVFDRFPRLVRDAARALGKQVDFVVEVKDVELDRSVLDEIGDPIVHLLRNAIEACTPASIVPHLEIEGRVDDSQGTLRVTVSDNGPGIEPAMRERIFRPFFTTRSQGTGLGLALVQKIIVTHNGRITVGASESGGAAFQIVLPLSGRR